MTRCTYNSDGELPITSHMNNNSMTRCTYNSD